MSTSNNIRVTSLVKYEGFKRGRINSVHSNNRDNPNGNVVEHPSVRDRMDRYLSQAFELVRSAFERHPDRAEDLLAHFRRSADDFSRAALPPAPAREMRPRENIIEYLRAEDGLGPWLRAGALSRPLLGKLSPRAYAALANWLRNPGNQLPADVDVPTLKELNDRKAADPAAVAEARRVKSNLRRRGVSL